MRDIQHGRDIIINDMRLGINESLGGSKVGWREGDRSQRL